MNTLQDRIRGSLIGGAIGDALGFIPKFFIDPNVIEAGEALDMSISRQRPVKE